MEEWAPVGVDVGAIEVVGVSEVLGMTEVVGMRFEVAEGVLVTVCTMSRPDVRSIVDHQGVEQCMRCRGLARGQKAKGEMKQVEWSTCGHDMVCRCGC